MSALRERYFNPTLAQAVAQQFFYQPIGEIVLPAWAANDPHACAWEPTPKQSEFLACSDYEVLYGGAAGGGKSDALIMDGWCIDHGGPDNPNHRAVVFRRTFPELKDLIDRARELFPQFIPGIKYDSNEHRFTTPAGAKFEFGYLNNDQDRFKYRGRAWNWIGFDELTLWPTDTCYNYLRSRNRSTDRSLPRLIRATTNPDGVGQRWVMERWGIEEDGKPVRLVRPMEFEEADGAGGYRMVMRHMARTFIPAKLVDNPFLRGTGYREILLDLPPEERDALILGLWRGNRVEGAYYFKELQAVRARGGIGKVPHLLGTPVNTFWDLGWNDCNSLWFHQQQVIENRFIHAYQNSGESIHHYAEYLQALSAERGYVYGTHYLPHDAANHSLQTGKTMLQLLREIMPGEQFFVVPKVEKLLVGIQQTRAVFPSCFFDEVECADGVASLGAYRKRWNKTIGAFTHEPIHDEHSNFADAFRQFAQGFRPASRVIENATPAWKKLLKTAAASRRRNPKTA